MNGNPIQITVPRDRGRVDPDFKAKYKLKGESKPWEFAKEFFPLLKDEKDSNNSFAFEFMMQWSNLKAALYDAGDTINKDYKPFTTKEIRKHFGLYVLHGLFPTPRVEYKFRPQRVDRVAGNDFVNQSFGKNAKNRHKHFKAFLSCCDPRIETPDRDSILNGKVRPLIKWINYHCPKPWQLGRAVSVDETKMRFKGRHRDKRRITYKADGDGFQ